MVPKDERRPCYMSLIKFRKGKFAHFIASSPAFVVEVVLPFSNSLGAAGWGWWKSSFLQSDSLFWGNSRSGNGEH